MGRSFSNNFWTLVYINGEELSCQNSINYFGVALHRSPKRPQHVSENQTSLSVSCIKFHHVPIQRFSWCVYLSGSTHLPSFFPRSLIKRYHINLSSSYPLIVAHLAIYSLNLSLPTTLKLVKSFPLTLLTYRRAFNSSLLVPTINIFMHVPSIQVFYRSMARFLKNSKIQHFNLKLWSGS